MGEWPLQLILDMLVQWSSTYLMLNHAEKLKDVSDLILYHDRHG